MDIKGIKVREYKGQLYALEEFDTYERRMIIACETGGPHTVNITIYTTETDKENVLEFVESRFKENVISWECAHWCTREQDDRTTEFLDEILKDI